MKQKIAKAIKRGVTSLLLVELINGVSFACLVILPKRWGSIHARLQRRGPVSFFEKANRLLKMIQRGCDVREFTGSAS